MSSHGPLFPLDADSTDYLLTKSHDFQSLWGFVLSSKFVYSVFQSRKNTILGAVAHNQFGLALPQAMHVVRRIGGDVTTTLIYEHQETSGSRDFAISPMQVRLLRDHATTVRMLEDIYSWREKDPRSRISQLSTTESLRFQRSVYRLWLLAAAYGPATLGHERSEGSISKALEFKDSVIPKQMTFLLSLDDKELVGVDEVHSFLLDLAKWALTKQTKRRTGRHSEGDENDLVWSGPAVTLDVFMGKHPGFGFADSQWRGTWRSMTRAFYATEIASITRGRATTADRQRFILDNIFLETIDCNHCRQAHSRRVSLWSRCNWEYMILVLPPSRLWSSLLFERKRPLEFLALFAEAVGSIPYQVFIEEVFDIRSERYQNWSKYDWLCIHCITELLSDSLQTWFDGKILKAPGVSH